MGAGIVGLAVARQLATAGVDVVVFEKEATVAAHQTGHNSGVVHAGIYYAPGSAKATMTRHGVNLLRAYCAERGLVWDERGKLVVARNAAEEVKLRELERRSTANGVPGVRWLSGAELREMEPDVAGACRAALPHHGHRRLPGHRPVVRRRCDRRRRPGADLDPGDRGVHGVRAQMTGWTLKPRPVPSASPGLSSAPACRRICSRRPRETRPAPEIIPFRGEYLRLRPHAADRVRRLIYPVPDPRYPFLGVHLTPRVDGTSDLGPNAVLALAREGYHRTDVTWDEISRLARSAAFRRLARQHWMTGVREYLGSFVRRAYLAEARTYLPWIQPGDVTSAPAGVRAQAVDPDGRLVDDFRINRVGPVTSVRNAPSPAATASMAIAEHIVAELGLPARNEES